MIRCKMYKIICYILGLWSVLFGFCTAFAQDKADIIPMIQTENISNTGRMTGLPLPRFVSLKGGETNMRRGPSKTHAVIWTYKKAGLPVEIINEYDNWRKVRDMDGSEGWIHQMVISGRRTVVTLDGTHIVRSGAGDDFSAVAKISGGVIAKPEKCKKNWCLLQHLQFEGWLPKSVLYGVYDDETFD